MLARLTAARHLGKTCEHIHDDVTYARHSSVFGQKTVDALLTEEELPVDVYCEAKLATVLYQEAE